MHVRIAPALDEWHRSAVSDEIGATRLTRLHGRVVKLERRRFRLEVVRGPDRGAGRDFGEAVVRVGARTVCDLQLTDPTVSAMHFEIRATVEGFVLRDLGSTNGTLVDGMRVVEAFLPGRAKLVVGETEIRFRADDEMVEVPLHGDPSFGPLLGQSAPMRALFADLV